MKRRSMILAGAKVFSGGTNFVMSLVFATFVSVAALGEYARLVNWTVFLAPFITLGLSPYFTRKIGQHGTDAVRVILIQGSRRVFVIAALGALLLAIAAFLEIKGIDRFGTRGLYVIATSSVIAGSLLIGGMFRGLGQPLLSEIPLLVVAPLILALGVLILRPHNYPGLFSIYACAQLAAFIILALRLWHQVEKPLPKVPRLPFNGQLLLSVASTSFVTSGQLALAGWLFDSKTMANLHLSYLIVNSVNLVFSSILTITQRDIAKTYSEKGAPDLQEVLNKTNRMIFMTGVPLILALALAIQIVSWFLPIGYESFSHYAYLFLVGQIFNIACGPTIMFYLMVGGEKFLNVCLISFATVGWVVASIGAQYSTAIFIACLALMTLGWNLTLVVMAKRFYGVDLQLLSFLLNIHDHERD